MACVPPRAGSDTARNFSIAQGVPFSKHCKMKQISARSSLWLKSCRGWPPVWNVRNMASQAVAIEEMEASEASEASEKKTMRWQRWQAHETMALIAAKKQQNLRGVESTEAAGIESKKTKNKWKEIEALCRQKGIERSAQQCQARWSRLTSAFTQIRSWEETKKPEQPSFWSLKLDERKTMGFLLSLDQKTYNALDELYKSKTYAVENAWVKDDGEAHEVNNQNNFRRSGYKCDEMVQAECLNFSKPSYKEKNESYVRNVDKNSFSEELEECKDEKQASRCKAMESTKILSACLQMVVDDSNKAQLLHATSGKMDFNSTNLHTGQQVDPLKVSGIAEHTNSLILCEQKDVNDKAQLVPANAEMIDGSNKVSCKGPLVVVDEHNEAELLHASAGNVDCNPTNLHTGQHTESIKFFGIAEHNNPLVAFDQKDANEEAQLLPPSAKMIDGSNTDSCKWSLKEHGAEENSFVMHWDGDNAQSSHVMHDKTMQAAKDKCIEKGADGSSSETNASVTDILVVGGIGNANSVSASVEESNSHLSSAGVDALSANRSRQIAGTALSCISIDKQDCTTVFKDRSLAEKACIDKNERGEGPFEVCKVKSFLCSKNAEDITIAWADNIQSKFIEAQMKNDACQTGEGTEAQLNNLVPIMEEAHVRSQMVLHTRVEQQQGDLSPLLDPKEETVTGVLKQSSVDNSTFPRINIFKSICSAQDKYSENIELQPSEEGHIAERNATVLECSTGPSFEEKTVEQLQNGKNEYNEKTTEPSQNIERFRVPVKDAHSSLQRESCDQLHSVYDRDGSDTVERVKVAIKEGEHLTEKIESTDDGNPPAVTCIQHQFQHADSASEQKSGSFGSVREAKRAEVSEVAAKELEFTIKDDRGTSGKGSIEDQSQKITTSSKADEDVFLYIPTATGILVRSALQTIRNFFKF